MINNPVIHATAFFHETGKRQNKESGDCETENEMQGSGLCCCSYSQLEENLKRER